MHKGSWLKYEGKFKNDKREGPGKAFFRKGKWIGNFKNGQPNGNGIWYGSDGNIVKGIW
jgi:antitoxin component YwqK of YwqJK toxin-antitoxin module